jgi:hypothetical protein
MADKLSFALDKEYKLKNDGSDIIVDVIFGDIGQSPDTTVKLDSKILLKEFKKSVDALLVGNDGDLSDKVLRINGNISDTSRKTNKISLDIIVRGGVKEFSRKFSVTVPDEGEVVIFSLVIRFFV